MHWMAVVRKKQSSLRDKFTKVEKPFCECFSFHPPWVRIRINLIRINSKLMFITYVILQQYTHKDFLKTLTIKRSSVIGIWKSLIPQLRSLHVLSFENDQGIEDNPSCATNPQRHYILTSSTKLHFKSLYSLKWKILNSIYIKGNSNRKTQHNIRMLAIEHTTFPFNGSVGKPLSLQFHMRDASRLGMSFNLKLRTNFEYKTKVISH